MNARAIGLLVFAHMATDISQGAIPVLLPFFIAEHNIGYAAAATVVFATNLVSTFMQPLFGHLADRRSIPWLIPVAMLCAGLGVSLTGIVPSFHIGVAVVALSGLGVAAFHPEGARMINLLSGTKKATAMSFFAVGGQLGYAVGPLIGTAAMLLWGLKGSVSIVLPAAIGAVLLMYTLPGISATRERKGGGPRVQPVQGQDAWVPFLILSAALLCRSIIFYGLNTFLPLFWINGLNQSKAAGGTALTLLMASSIGGNLLGGRAADRFGFRAVVITGFVCLMLFLPLLALAKSVAVATLLLIPIGLAFSVPTSPLVVLGQQYLPNRLGLASGVTLGLAFSFGGILMPVLGRIADLYGLHAAISTLACIPVVCTALALALPKPKVQSST